MAPAHKIFHKSSASPPTGGVSSQHNLHFSHLPDAFKVIVQLRKAGLAISGVVWVKSLDQGPSGHQFARDLTQ